MELSKKKKKKLKIDDKTHWNSTCLMLKSCERYETIITQYFSIQQKDA